ARSLGPALASGNFTDFWIYIVGPIFGAIAAVPVWQFIRLAKRNPEGNRRRNQPKRSPKKGQQPRRNR
ncbi:MAG: hypothetical protein CMO63_07515, partial [Verrucomicrobiales bacterium]|nr:hypothetical protein [Verrucomicrobiales bacterium]